jgi:hypothetical protein
LDFKEWVLEEKPWQWRSMPKSLLKALLHKDAKP